MHLPANTFSGRHESCGEDTSNSRGTVLTASGSANAKGAWATLKSATSFAYEAVTVYATNPSQAASTLYDIGIDDGAGNVFVLIADLRLSPFGGALFEQNLGIYVPVHVPAGAMLVARSASIAGSSTSCVVVVGHSSGVGGAPGLSRLIALNTFTQSRGVAIDPGVAANTKGSWVEMTSSAPRDLAALVAIIGHNNDTARAAAATMLLDIGIGAGGSEQVVIPDLFLNWGPTWDCPANVYFQPMPVAIPAGTRVAARAQCSLTTSGDRTVDLSLYGLVA